MNRVFPLFRLQQIDTQLDQARVRLREIEAILNDDTELRQAEDGLVVAKQTLEKARKGLRKAEDKTRAQRAKIDATENRLYGGKVQNPKELQDLQRESEALKRYLEVLEERQLEEMMALDELEGQSIQAQNTLEDVRARRIEGHAALNGERRAIMDQVEKLQTERLAAVNSISENELSRYDRLRKRRAGIAVAKVTDRSCSACGNHLSTSQYQVALSPNEIALCDNCGRILYVG